MIDKKVKNFFRDYFRGTLDNATRNEIDLYLEQAAVHSSKRGAASMYVDAANALEPELAADNFLRDACKLIDQEEKLIDFLFRPLYIKLPITVIGMAGIIVFCIVMYTSYSGMHTERIVEYTVADRDAGPVEIPPSEVDSLPEQKLIIPENVHKPDLKSVSEKKIPVKHVVMTDRPVISTSDKSKMKAPFVTSNNTPKRIPPRKTAPIQSLRKKEEDVSVNGFIEYDDGDIDKVADATAFYEPVNSRPGERTQTSKAASGYTGRSSSSFVVKNRGRIIANLVQHFGGNIDSVLERSGDYYKVRLFLSEKKLEPFQKALAEKAVFSSFTFTPGASENDTLDIILETLPR